MKSLKERFDAHHVKLSSPCWLWQRIFPAGYGQISVNGANTTAHRLSYELHIGPVPEGMDIHHLCHNRACVNPDHLEAVTRAEHVRRQPLRRARWRDQAPTAHRILDALGEREDRLRELVALLGEPYAKVAIALHSVKIRHLALNKSGIWGAGNSNRQVAAAIVKNCQH
jgi:hypothetical protein